MSIATDMNRLTIAKSGIITSLTNKGVMVPNDVKVNEFPNLIDSIPSPAPNGSVWTTCPPVPGLEKMTPMYARCIFCYNGRWVSGCQGGLVYSDDGINWKLTNIVSSSIGSFHTVYAANGVWVAGSWGNGIYTSKDGITWLQQTETNGLKVEKVLEYAGHWVAACDNGGIYRAMYSDATRWRSTYNPGRGCINLYAAAGVWITSTISATYYAYDEDLTYWRTCSGTAETRDLCYHNGVFIGTNGMEIYSSTNGASWVLEVGDNGNWYGSIVASDNFWVMSSDNGMFYSNNGKSWTLSNCISSYSNIAYGAGVWVATSSASKKGIIYSVDGKWWKNANITTGGVDAIFYHNGMWVSADDFSKTNVYYSRAWNKS